MKFSLWVLLLFLLAASAAAPAARAQAESEPAEFSRSMAPKVFLDCNRCDFSFIKQEITFVNYVRDPELAQVHVFVTDQQTGSGGRNYTFSFTGQQNYTGLDNTLSYVSQQTDTWAEERSGVAEMLKLGLVPYVAQTPLARQVSVSFAEGEQRRTPEPLNDPWNSWVFDIEGSGSFNFEATRNAYSVNGSVSADRVTEDWKVRTRLYGNYDERNFETQTEVDGETVTEVITSTSQRSGVNASIVKSVGGHWSAGFFGDIHSNTYRNTDFSTGITPAVEYNYFPYEESSRREWVFVYRIGYDYRNYIERTVFNKMEEMLLQQSLQTFVRFRQPWGFVYAQLSGSHYLHDFSANSINFYSNLSVRLVRGLSLRFSGGLDIIHDQLYLAAGEASLEEILLQRKQLATTYEVSGSIGLAYTFGSIYNNIVNTRL